MGTRAMVAPRKSEISSLPCPLSMRGNTASMKPR
jgi:hypothetical protein